MCHPNQPHDNHPFPTSLLYNLDQNNRHLLNQGPNPNLLPNNLPHNLLPNNLPHNLLLNNPLLDLNLLLNNLLQDLNPLPNNLRQDLNLLLNLLLPPKTPWFKIVCPVSILLVLTKIAHLPYNGLIPLLDSLSNRLIIVPMFVSNIRLSHPMVDKYYSLPRPHVPVP
jgi:hypothetical protein